MPIYIYKNLTTGDTFEVQQSIKDDALTLDPATGDPVKRMIQPVGIAFKGSGFYVNDSKSNSSATQSKVKDQGNAAESSKSETKTESKAEAKPESKTESKPKSSENSSTSTSKPAASS